MNKKQIMDTLSKKAFQRAGGKIKPLPGKTWEECFVVQKGNAELHFHAGDDPSSKMVYVKMHEELYFKEFITWLRLYNVFRKNKNIRSAEHALAKAANVQKLYVNAN